MKTFFFAAAVAAFAVSGATVRNGAQQPPSFSARSEIVVLHVLVKDQRGGYVSGLPEEAFRVFEDNVPQAVKFFAPEDTPVTVGLIVDNSSSMAPVRDRVIAALSAFVRSSNPQDEVFALVFDDTVREVLDPRTPFTSDVGVLKRALANVFVPAGRTALYDAISEGLRYVKGGSRNRQALVVLSDGGDNASKASFTDTMVATQSSNTVVYTIALVDPANADADPVHLAQFAQTSGGTAFAPGDIAGVDRAFQQIARDIRHSYTIGYEPLGNGRQPGFHHLRVEVHATNGRKLQARTREGYHAS